MTTKTQPHGVAIFGDCKHPRRKNTKAIGGETACLLGRRADGTIASYCCECIHFERGGVAERLARRTRPATQIVCRGEVKRDGDGHPYWEVTTSGASRPSKLKPGESLGVEPGTYRAGTVFLIMEPMR